MVITKTTKKNLSAFLEGDRIPWLLVVPHSVNDWMALVTHTYIFLLLVATANTTADEASANIEGKNDLYGH